MVPTIAKNCEHNRENCRDFFANSFVETIARERKMKESKTENKLITALSVVHSPTPETTDQLLIENHWLRSQLVHACAQIASDLQSFERLRQQSQTDCLTHTPTRLLLADRAQQAFQQAHRQGTEVMVIFIDIDHFKQINDSFGHSVGDQVLVYLANRLQQGLRSSDTVCRYGGDEFVLLLPLTDDSADVSSMISKILYAATLPININQQVIIPEISIGVAIYPKHGTELNSLIHKADLAMYEAKANGGHHYRMSHDVTEPLRLPRLPSRQQHNGHAK
jgi:diguanylate cyclase (GGDEF)-like protein